MLPEFVDHGFAPVARDAQHSNARMFDEQLLALRGEVCILKAHHDHVGARGVHELRQIDVANRFANELNARFGIKASANDVPQNLREIDD